MSVKCMSAVWEHSAEKGSALLLLLAIADNANDMGHAWPGTKVLAKKTRLSRQTVHNLLKRLERSGELIIHRKRGKRNQYLVLTGMTEEAQKQAVAAFNERIGIVPESGRLQADEKKPVKTSLPVNKAEPVKRGLQPDKDEPVNPSLQPPVKTGLQHLSTRVDTIHQEPSLKPPDSGAPPLADAPQGEPDAMTEKLPAPTDSPSKPEHKRRRTPNPLFDAVCRRLFQVDPYGEERQAVAGRVGKAMKALRQVKSTLHEFGAACDWWQREKEGISLPKDDEKVASMILEYRAARHDEQQTNRRRTYYDGTTREEMLQQLRATMPDREVENVSVS